MAQNTRVSKYQKLRSDIEQLDDGNFKNPPKPNNPTPEVNGTQEIHIPDPHPLTEPITRGAMNIPLEELMKNHTKITNDESFVTEEQVALEEKKSKLYSIVGTIATILIVVSLVVGLGLLLWGLLDK
ncbi:MAG: hypothetical protein NTV44_04185 [Firmicutes bacterium]|nr:hypothetical protein [Bacillota bacterium]